jgi:hypothetical protein
LPNILGLAGNYFLAEVINYVPVTAGEAADEILRSWVTSQRQGREVHTRRPPLSSFDKLGQALLAQPDGGHALDERLRLLRREMKLVDADLGQLARRPQLCQGQRRVGPGAQHDLCR